MFKRNLYRYLGIGCFCLAYAACKVPELTGRAENKTVPAAFAGSQDATGKPGWNTRSGTSRT